MYTWYFCWLEWYTVFILFFSFPLFTKSKDIQFNYAVYLLNKNVAQLRFLCGIHTSDLKATLPNLLGLLQGKMLHTDELHVARTPADNDHTLKQQKVITSIESADGDGSDKTADQRQLERPSDFSLKIVPLHNYNLGINQTVSDPILDSLKSETQEQQMNSYRNMRKPNKREKNHECGPGLSDILAIPEAFLNQEISSTCFKTYITSEKLKTIKVDDNIDGK